MQYYSAKLRLAGSTMNEVRGIWSVPEILVLQYIHGVDALSGIKLEYEKKINLYDHKQYLKSRFDSALVKRDQSVDGIFGALGQIPEELPKGVCKSFESMKDNSVPEAIDTNSLSDIAQDKFRRKVSPAKVDVSNLVE